MIILIPYFFMEIYISLAMLEEIGAFWATLWTFATMILGSALLKNSPYTIMGNMQSLQRGKLDFQKFQDATTSYFVGALLLIVPGVLSDFMGVSALVYTVYTNTQTEGEKDVIDVEIVDEHTADSDRIERH